VLRAAGDKCISSSLSTEGPESFLDHRNQLLLLRLAGEHYSMKIMSQGPEPPFIAPEAAKDMPDETKGHLPQPEAQITGPAIVKAKPEDGHYDLVEYNSTDVKLVAQLEHIQPTEYEHEDIYLVQFKVI
jgi:hypothetical protein